MGGGEIQRNETKKIDEIMIAQTKKKNPKLLFIPTASNDAQLYVDNVKKYFSDMECAVDVLYLIKKSFQKNKSKIKFYQQILFMLVVVIRLE